MAHDLLSVSTSLTQTTPVRAGFRVPVGHIIVSDKWRGTELTQALQGSVRVVYNDEPGVVDFQPSSDVATVYISEGDLVAGMTYRRKLAKLRKTQGVRGIVLAENTPISTQYFTALQKFAVLELGLVLLPVSSQSEAAQLLSQMVSVENRPNQNQFRMRRKPGSIDEDLLATVQTIPRLGEVKARLLLGKFKTITAIAMASEEELARVVGRACAVQVMEFFNLPPKR